MGSGGEAWVGRTAREVLDIDAFRVVLDVRHLTKDMARELARQHRVSVFAMELILGIVERAVYLEDCQVPVEEWLRKARWLARDAVVLAHTFSHVVALKDVVEMLEEKAKKLESIVAEAEKGVGLERIA